MVIKKCVICGQESKAVHLHMKKHEGEKTPSLISKIVNFVAPKKDSHPSSTQETPQEMIQPPSSIVSDSPVVSTEWAAPVPVDFRNVVDEVLNKSFGIEINPKSDSPSFEFSILVPERYSDVSAAYKQMYGVDKRLKVIDYSSGTSGVREWAERVFSSFNPDRRSMIVADRIKGS